MLKHRVSLSLIVILSAVVFHAQYAAAAETRPIVVLQLASDDAQWAESAIQPALLTSEAAPARGVLQLSVDRTELAQAGAENPALRSTETAQEV